MHNVTLDHEQSHKPFLTYISLNGFSGSPWQMYQNTYISTERKIPGKTYFSRILILIWVSSDTLRKRFSYFLDSGLLFFFPISKELTLSPDLIIWLYKGNKGKKRLVHLQFGRTKMICRTRWSMVYLTRWYWLKLKRNKY